MNPELDPEYRAAIDAWDTASMRVIDEKRRELERQSRILAAQETHHKACLAERLASIERARALDGPYLPEKWAEARRVAELASAHRATTSAALGSTLAVGVDQSIGDLLRAEHAAYHAIEDAYRAATTRALAALDRGDPP